MKKLVLLSLTLVLLFPAMSQDTKDYYELLKTVLKMEKKAAVSDVMRLSEPEGELFWPLYDEYNAKMSDLESRRVDLIFDYANHYENMTDEKADELWSNVMEYKQDALKLTKTYYKKIKRILPEAKAALYFQVENKITALIDYELAVQIPLLPTD
ncbi:MAG: hypothetical protein KDC05_08955 [Bacteroidales bacterium]|nr:hypothetical protein [Bacteroidales bacterium]